MARDRIDPKALAHALGYRGEEEDLFAERFDVPGRRLWIEMLADSDTVELEPPLYAITPYEIAAPVGARAIGPSMPLVEGETFVADNWNETMVLAEDGVSLRQGTPEELADPTATPLKEGDEAVAE